MLKTSQTTVVVKGIMKDQKFKWYTEISINRAENSEVLQGLQLSLVARRGHSWPFFNDKRFKSRCPLVAFPRHKSSTNE